MQSNIANSGELRPAELRKDTGYLAREEDLEKRPVSPLWMSQEEVGARVLDGIRNNDLYILTHPEFRAGMQKRFDAIMASVPDEEINEARAKEIFFLLDNPIWDEVLAKKA